MAINKTPDEIFSELPLPFVNNDVKSLASSTAETFTAPAGASAVIFSGSSALGDYWIQFRQGVTAAVPGDTSDGSAPALNPAMVKGITAGQTFSVISANAGILVAHWMARPSYSG